MQDIELVFPSSLALLAPSVCFLFSFFCFLSSFENQIHCLALCGKSIEFINRMCFHSHDMQIILEKYEISVSLFDTTAAPHCSSVCLVWLILFLLTK